MENILKRDCQPNSIFYSLEQHEIRSCPIMGFRNMKALSRIVDKRNSLERFITIKNI